METTDEQHIEKAQAKSAVYELITQDQIDANIVRLQSEFDIDLEGVTIHSAKPGDSLFDQHEIQHKLLQKCGSDFKEMSVRIKSYGYDPEDISIAGLRNIAEKEGIVLEGYLPGFALAAGDDEIIFFAVKGSSAIEMATNYAAKEGESHLIFITIKEAVDYLKGLANKAFFHEVAHIIYARGEFDEWDKYIAMKPEIKQHVIRLQQDKYGNVEQIRVAEEAFADFAVEVLSGDRVISRLGKNEEATSKVETYLNRNQNNT